MKSNYMKIFAILTALLMMFTLNACDPSGDGEDGAHSVRNLLNEGQAPVANAGADQSVVAGDTIVLDGSKSYDPDGTIDSYIWNLGDLGTRTGETVTETIPGNAVSGNYVITLTVTDNNGNVDSDTITVVVEGVEDEPSTNKSPHANAGEDQNVVLGDYYGSPGDAKIIAALDGTLASSVTVELDGSKSSDDGLISPLTYTWKLVQSGTSIKPEIDNNATDKPKVTLTCETAFEDINDCTRNDNNITCEYVYELTVFDGEFSDKDNVTVSAAYDRSCFPD
ncbi:hypothetical protein MNB_SV-8-1364 [hydrothermal vent metagenome]|uniref:PKD domain-containing protein n=1 Tax=hydrothermal vent metagenome TaxID=652676 RepID=A0A1W1BGT6_9ZZZZ